MPPPPPAEPRALVLGAPPMALLMLRVFGILADHTSVGRRSAVGWAGIWYKNRPFPTQARTSALPPAAAKGAVPGEALPAALAPAGHGPGPLDGVQGKELELPRAAAQW